MGAALRRHPLIFLITMALNAALSAGQVLKPINLWLFRPATAETTVHTGLVYMGARLGVLLLATLVATPLAVRVHRFVLGREGQESQVAFISVCINYFCWVAGLQLVFLAGYAYSLLASSVAFVRGIIDALVTVAAAVVTRRLLLVFPAVAIGVTSKGAEDRIEKSWQQMTGNLMLAVRAVFLTLLPLIVLLFILAKLGLPKPPAVPPIPTPPPAPPPVTTLLIIGHGLMGAVNALLVAVTAAFASLFYRATKKA